MGAGLEKETRKFSVQGTNRDILILEFGVKLKDHKSVTTSLFLVNIGYIGYINPGYFPRNSIYL